MKTTVKSLLKEWGMVNEIVVSESIEHVFKRFQTNKKESIEYTLEVNDDGKIIDATQFIEAENGMGATGRDKAMIGKLFTSIRKALLEKGYTEIDIGG